MPLKTPQINQKPGRVVITNVSPEINGGHFSIKRTVGEYVSVESNLFSDGHEVLAGLLLSRHEEETRWSETPLVFMQNDKWTAKFQTKKVGTTVYTIEGWVDSFQTWLRDMEKRVKAGQDVRIDLLSGAAFLEEAGKRASKKDSQILMDWADQIANKNSLVEDRLKLVFSEKLINLVNAYPDRRVSTTYEKELSVVVDRERALHGAWYELFPRSCAPESHLHGTFADTEKWLPRIASLGFDVLYFPPIHPIGKTHRKGRNNTTVATSESVGSPWAIGGEEGGHKDIHPQLGTMNDFHRLLKKAGGHNIEIALDIAFQCSPDHPYVREHPDWFRKRPDGSIQYAENPPKKYEDIYPLDLDCEDWKSLWNELKSVFEFWAEQGVRIFRVDNPHTKPFPFWEWVIRELKTKYPDVLFLSEAFTRPAVMYHLAKLGFTQSYNYFPWRNTKWELIDYFKELTQTEVREYFRPNLWPNTPDILTVTLQHGGRPAFIARFVLSATLGASYGLYGPAFELCENQAKEPGSEEYFNSEKYEIKYRNMKKPGNISEIIARVNKIRRQHSAFRTNSTLQFHGTDNDQLLCYSKHAEDGSHTLLMVINLDPYQTQSGTVYLSSENVPFPVSMGYRSHDLLTDISYVWNGPRNYVELNPSLLPAHIFRLEHLDK